MNLPVQGIYGGSRANLSAYRKKQIRMGMHRTAMQIVLFLAIFAGVMSAYYALDNMYSERALANNSSSLCLATSIAAIQNSTQAE